MLKSWTGALLLLAAFVLASGVLAEIRYVIEDLGQLPAPRRLLFANSINDLGQVCGTYIEAQIGDELANRAFIWDEVNGMQNLGTLDGGIDSYGNRINNLGQVAGYSVSRSSQNACIWDPFKGIINLTSASSFGRALGINNLGEAVGIEGTRAFFWSPQGGLEHIEQPPDSLISLATSINDQSEVVGTYRSVSTLVPFIWSASKGTRQLFDSPAYSFCTVEEINNNSEVVGSISVIGGRGYQNVYFCNEATGMLLLEGPGEFDRMICGGTNDAGQVVGTNDSTDFEEIPFLWLPGEKVIYLNDVISKKSRGWQLRQASDINNFGQITGLGINPFGQWSGFRATPIEE